MRGKAEKSATRPTVKVMVTSSESEVAKAKLLKGSKRAEMIIKMVSGCFDIFTRQWP